MLQFLLPVIVIYSSPLEEMAETCIPVVAKETEMTLKGGRTIVVQEFVFTGNDKVTTKQLSGMLSPYLNRPLSSFDLEAIKRRIKVLYKSRGYPNAEVSIPSKRKKGSLEIVIKEGKKST